MKNLILKFNLNHNESAILNQKNILPQSSQNAQREQKHLSFLCALCELCGINNFIFTPFSFLKNRYFLILWILCAAGDMHAQTPSKMLSFQELHSQVASTENTIQIRGFLYKDDKGTWVLLNTPNLQSCCIDKQQIILNIDGTFTDPGLQGVAVLIEGELQKSPTLTLINARLINEDKGMDTIYLILAGLGLLLVIAFWIKK